MAEDGVAALFAGSDGTNTNVVNVADHVALDPDGLQPQPQTPASMERRAFFHFMAGDDMNAVAVVSLAKAPTVDLAPGSDTGVLGDGITSDRTPTIAYSVDAGATVRIDWGDGRGFSRAPNGDGSLQRATLGAGYPTYDPRTITVEATNAAGDTETTRLQIELVPYPRPPHAPALWPEMPPGAIGLDTLNGENGFRLEGREPGGRAGWAVGAGDFNGDGHDDLLIGAQHAGIAGEVYVVFGGDARFPAVGNLGALDGTNGFRLVGATVFEEAGRSVSSAGDVNRDGYDDILIGAWSADGDAGRSYLVFGQAGGFAPAFDLATLDGTNGFRLDGIDAGDESGRRVSSAGDLNADGFADVVIGAPRADRGGNDAGETYVVFGRASGFAATIDLASLDGTNGLRLDGATPGDWSGIAVSEAGDVTGDGIDDLLIGASELGGTGAVYLVPGRTGGFAASEILGGNPTGFRWTGAAAGDEVGFSVSAAGDFDGDGLNDIVIGAPGRGGSTSNPGAAYLVYGSAALPASGEMNLGDLTATQGFRISGIDAGDTAGYSVGSAGDFNGDGLDDLLISSELADPGGRFIAGEVHVVFGQSDRMLHDLDLDDLDGANGLRFDGISSGDTAGHFVSGAGDFDGDGFDDIVIGAPGADPSLRYLAGESYVVLGMAPTLPVSRRGTDIAQTIRGGAFSDMLDGLDGDDSLYGGGFNDTLRGGAGADLLAGGEGYDWADYAGSDLGVAVNLAAGTASGGHADGDRLEGVEMLVGSAHDDSLTGDDGNNLIRGGFGRDTMRGGEGIDWLDYRGSGASVAVNLATNFVTTNDIIGGDATGDVIFGFERVLGTDFWDVLRGDGGSNTFRGGAGADTMDGGDGQDRLDYRGSDAAVAVNLATGSVGGGHAEGDVISGFEHIIGSMHDDMLTGDDGDNLIHGGRGADTIDGGDGHDIASYRGSYGGVNVRVLTSTPGALHDAAGDILIRMEEVWGTDFDDALSGYAMPVTLLGFDGADTLGGSFSSDSLFGGDGDDEITGEGGNDRLRGGNGDDWIRGNHNDDRLHGDAGNDRLIGDTGDDSVFGGDGDDSLSGAMGRDRLTGGAGADNFSFAYTRESSADFGIDVIVDFESGDVIDLSRIDAITRMGMAGNQSFTFVGTGALGTAGTLRYESFGTGVTVQGDTNGNGRADFILQVLDVTTLSAGDFLL